MHHNELTMTAVLGIEFHYGVYCLYTPAEKV